MKKIILNGLPGLLLAAAFFFTDASAQGPATDLAVTSDKITSGNGIPAPSNASVPTPFLSSASLSFKMEPNMNGTIKLSLAARWEMQPAVRYNGKTYTHQNLPNAPFGAFSLSNAVFSAEVFAGDQKINAFDWTFSGSAKAGDWSSEEVLEKRWLELVGEYSQDQQRAFLEAGVYLKNLEIKSASFAGGDAFRAAVEEAERQPVPSSGNARTGNWQPSSQYSQEAVPSISSISLRFDLLPEDSYCLKKYSVLWQIGDEVWFGGQKTGRPAVEQSDLETFGIDGIRLKGRAFSNGYAIGEMEFALNNLARSGSWSNETADRVDWGSMFRGLSAEDAKKMMSKNIEIKDLSVVSVEFNGGQEFRNRVYQRNMSRADELYNQKEYRNAAQLYESAFVFKKGDNYASSRIQTIKNLLYTFDNAMSSADRLYRDGHFLEAKRAYETASGIMPAGRDTERKIEEIENRERRYYELKEQADRLFRGAYGDVSALRSALAVYQEAGAALPRDKSDEIGRETARIEQELRHLFNQRIQSGQRNMASRDYVGAVREAQSALQVLPGNGEALQLIKNSENALYLDIKGRYDREASLYGRERAVVLQKAAEAVLPANEQCLLQESDFYTCKQRRLEKLAGNASEEMRAQIYGSYYPLPQDDCYKPNCSVMFEGSSFTAWEYLEAAKRKQGLFEERADASFAQSRQNLLGKALSRNPDFAEAILFKAGFENQTLEAVLLVRKALTLKPGYEEAQTKLSALQPLFEKEFYGAILKNDFPYLDKSINNRLVGDIGKFGTYSPYDYAVKTDNYAMLSRLLSGKNAFPASFDASNGHLLAVAAAENAPKTAQKLLDAGTDPNFQDADSEYLMHKAVRGNQLWLVKALFAKGGRFSVRSAQGESPLNIALKADYKEISKFIIKNSKTGDLDPKLLFDAVGNNAYTLVGELIQKGADVNVGDGYGNTPLHLAIQKNYLNSAQLLMLNGADINRPNGKGETPLLLAAYAGMGDLCEMLLSQGAKSDRRDDKGRSPMMGLLDKNLYGIAEALLNNYTSLEADYSNAKNAGATDFESKMPYLLLRKAVSSNDKSFAEKAVIRKPDAAFSSLAISDSLWLKAARANKNALALAMIAYVQDMPLNDKGLTPLHAAIQMGNQEIALALAERPSNLKTATIFKETPLHFAVLYSSDMLFIEKIARGNMVDATDFKGKTALHYAVEQGNVEKTRLLVSEKASLKIKDSRGWTPAKTAKKLGFKELKIWLK